MTLSSLTVLSNERKNILSIFCWTLASQMAIVALSVCIDVIGMSLIAHVLWLSCIPLCLFVPLYLSRTRRCSLEDGKVLDADKKDITLSLLESIIYWFFIYISWRAGFSLQTSMEQFFYGAQQIAIEIAPLHLRLIHAFVLLNEITTFWVVLCPYLAFCYIKDIPLRAIVIYFSSHGSSLKSFAKEWKDKAKKTSGEGSDPQIFQNWKRQWNARSHSKSYDPAYSFSFSNINHRRK